MEQALGGWCPPPIKVSPLLLHMLTRQQEQEWTQYSSASSARSGLAGATQGSSASLQNPNQHLSPTSPPPDSNWGMGTLVMVVTDGVLVLLVSEYSRLILIRVD